MLVGGGQRGERVRERGAVGDQVRGVLDPAGRHGVLAGPGQRPQTAYFLPALLADEVRGDPVQPGPGTGPRGVVAGTHPERGQERVGRDVVRRVVAEAPGRVPVDVGCVPVVEPGKQLRMFQGLRDDVAVALITGIERRWSGHGSSVSG